MLANTLILTIAWLQALLPSLGEAAPSRVEHRAPTEGEVRLERATPDLPVDPDVLSALPPLKRLPVAKITAPWKELKELRDTAEQHRQIAQRSLLARVADDLTPVTSLDDAFGTNLRRRDMWRGRVWARPAMLAVLRRASQLLAERLPGTIVTVGDVAQEGGGQIAFGTQVRLLRDGPIRTPARDLLARAQLHLGRVETVDIVDPHLAFPVEASRFAEFEDPVILERRVTAVEPCARPGHEEGAECPLTIRVETRRYWLDEPIGERRAKRLLAEIRRALRVGTVVERVKAERPGGHLDRTTFVQGKNVVEVFARKRPSGKLALRDVVEVRRATLDASKPGVAVRESRYLPEDGPDGLQLVVWREQYEATHVSHMGGLDADISYVMSGIDYQFTRQIEELDVEASRTWIETVVDAARDVGATVDRILIDPRVRWRLVKGMSRERKKHPAWGLIRSSRGHDSHMHLRLRPGLGAIADGDSPR